MFGADHLQLHRAKHPLRYYMGSFHPFGSVGLHTKTSFVTHDVCCATFSNIFEKRYGLTEDVASTQASYLLVGSILLYPVVSAFQISQ
jgi:hypothetical protein